MIQPLRSAKIVWLVDWMDLDVPVPIGTGESFVLPTCLLVASDNGTKLIGQEAFRELDQRRAESLLGRLMNDFGTPDLVLVRYSDEWDDLAWDSFSRNYRCEVRLVDPEGENTRDSRFEQVDRLKDQVVNHILETAKELNLRLGLSPAEVAAALVRTAGQVRSPAKKTAMYQHALKLEKNCSLAMLGLGDLEFQSGNLKQALQQYNRVVRMENARFTQPHVVWWADVSTRPLLKAMHGRLMSRWHQGDFSGAIGDAEDLLKLNPVDNQGVRFLLPMLYLVAEQTEAAQSFFRSYDERYPKDFSEPAFFFGWGLAMMLDDEEQIALEKYRRGMVRNLFIAPILLDLPEPPLDLWMPNDRAEPGYAAEFYDSFAVLWERDPAALRFLRESYDRSRPLLEKLIELRVRMTDFQDQRYEPAHEQRWQELAAEEKALIGEWE